MSVAEAEVELAWAREAQQVAQHALEETSARREDVATEQRAMQVVVQQADTEHVAAARFALELLEEQFERLSTLHALRQTELRFCQERAIDAQAMCHRLASEHAQLQHASAAVQAVDIPTQEGSLEEGSGAVPDDLLSAQSTADIEVEPPTRWKALAVHAVISVRGERATLSLTHEESFREASEPIPSMALDGDGSTPRGPVPAVQQPRESASDSTSVPGELLAEASALSWALSRATTPLVLPPPPPPPAPTLPKIKVKSALPVTGTVFNPSRKRVEARTALIAPQAEQRPVLPEVEAQMPRAKSAAPVEPQKASTSPKKRARSISSSSSVSNKKPISTPAEKQPAVVAAAPSEPAPPATALPLETVIEDSPMQPEVVDSSAAEVRKPPTAEHIAPEIVSQQKPETTEPIAPVFEPVAEVPMPGVQPSSPRPQTEPMTEAPPLSVVAPPPVMVLARQSSSVIAAEELMALVRGTGTTPSHATKAADSAANELRQATRKLMMLPDSPSNAAVSPAASAADELRSMTRTLLSSQPGAPQSPMVASAASDLLQAVAFATTPRAPSESAQEITPYEDAVQPAPAAQTSFTAQPGRPSPLRPEASRAISETTARERQAAAQRARDAVEAKKRAERERAEAAAAQRRAVAEERRQAAEQARKQAEQQRAMEQAKMRAAAEEKRQAMEAAKRLRAEEALAKQQALVQEQRRMAEATRLEVERERAEAAAAKQRALAEERARAEDAARKQAEQQRLEAEAALARGHAERMRIAEEAMKKRVADEEAAKARRAVEEQRRMAEEARQQAERTRAEEAALARSLAERQRIAEEAAKKRLAEEEAAKARRAAEEQRRLEDEARQQAERNRAEAAAAKAKALAEERRREEQAAAQRLAALDAQARALAEERMRVSAQKKAASASRQAALKKQVVLVHREELEQQQRVVDAPPVPQVLPTERLLHHDTAAAAVPRPVQQKAARPKQQVAATPPPVAAEASVDALPPKKAKKTADVDEEPTTDWYKIRR